MISLKDKLNEGFFGNVGAGINGFFNEIKRIPCVNTYFGEIWQKEYDYEVKNGYLYIHKNDAGKDFTGKVHVHSRLYSVRFNLAKGVFWQTLMSHGNPKDIVFRLDPSPDGLHIRFWDHSVKNNRWGNNIACIVIGQHDIYEASINDPDGLYEFDMKDFLGYGSHTVGAFTGADAVTDKGTLKKYFAFEKSK